MMTESTTTMVKVTIETDAEIQSFYAEALKLQQYAETRAIVTVDDLKPATDDLSIIGKLKKAMEERRREYVVPRQDEIKAFNEAFKNLMEPVETADKVTRQKILAFNAEQNRIRQEQEEINRKRQEADEAERKLKGEVSVPIRLVEVIPPALKRTDTDMGSSGMRDNWKWEIVDQKLVPEEYKMINAGILTPVVKASKGKITIPGIRIYNEPILAVNVK